MNTFIPKHRLRYGLLALLAMQLLAPQRSQAQDVELSPPYEPVQLQPSLADFLLARPIAEMKKKCCTDKLLQPPFTGKPVDTPKGLASKIRAEELDIKNRILAVRYLGTLDCVAYPEAKEMLIEVLHNDKWEPVRFEAAKALKVMLSRGCRCSCRQPKGLAACSDKGKKCCNNVKGMATDTHKALKDVFCCCKNPKEVFCELSKKTHERICSKESAEERRYDHCRGCCDKDVLNALAKTAYELDEVGCCFEPSRRVREMAVEAIKACGIPCNFGPYQPSRGMPQMAPPPDDSDALPEEAPPAGGEEKPLDQGEERSSNDDGFRARVGSPGLPTFRISQEKQRIDFGKTEIEALNGYCIVGLKLRQFNKALPDFQSVHEGRTYHFASAAAKAEFDRTPDAYSVAFGGIDPVAYERSQQATEGIYLREYNNRFFLFVSRDNWETFKQSPENYVPRSMLAKQKTASIRF